MKTCIYILLGFSLLQMYACNDYLEYKNGDQVIPHTLEHYDELIYGEIIKKSTGNEMAYLPVMTDDVGDYISMYYKEDCRKTYFPYYTWAIENQRGLQGVEITDNAWGFFYHKILMCNIVLKEVALLQEDIKGVKNRLLGEVSFMRAMSYYYLVNLYGEVYQNAEQAQSAWGVPINNETGVVNTLYTRARLYEVYNLIESDLLNAIDYLGKGEQLHSIFKPNVDVARLLLSRVYLYQKRYTEAITVCNDLIKSTAATVETLDNIEKYPEVNYSKLPFYNSTNKSILFSWSTITEEAWASRYVYMGHFYCASPALIELFAEKEDIRASIFVDWNNLPAKRQLYLEDAIYDRCFRIEEAYLNRAEAIIESSENFDAAMQDVEMIRKNRITTDYEVRATSREEARSEFRKEKRMEFCFEEIRWFDIRRWGLEVIHRYHDANNPENYQEYKLRSGSPNYVLSIPLDVQRLNPNIERLSREEIRSNN